jgi:DNA polymerase III alpha subunit
MCLGVTGKIMDPIKNGLLFERFISNERLVDCYIDYSKEGNKQ